MKDAIFPMCCGLCGAELHTDENTTMNNIGQEHFEVCVFTPEWNRNRIEFARKLNNEAREARKLKNEAL